MHYIVSNSTSNRVVQPVERISTALFKDAGFHDVDIRDICKRMSKKELYE